MEVSKRMNESMDDEGNVTIEGKGRSNIYQQ